MDSIVGYGIKRIMYSEWGFKQAMRRSTTTEAHSSTNLRTADAQ